MTVAGAALVIALAGTAMAAPTAIKSVLNKQEKKQVKNIAKGQVNELGPGLSVANAANAQSATSAQSADNAQTVNGHSAACPAGTFLHHGLCFDSVARTAVTFGTAANTCNGLGGDLPALTGLRGTRGIAGIDLGATDTMSAHWVDAVHEDDDGVGLNSMTVGDDGSVAPADINSTHAYRCVYQLVR